VVAIKDKLPSIAEESGEKVPLLKEEEKIL
jgi:hypothetical protein